jgi:hypothetical protein
MQFDTELLLIAMAAVFLTCIGRQAWHLRRTRPREPIYSSRDPLCKPDSLMRQAANKLARLATIPVLRILLPARAQPQMPGGLDLVRRAVHRAGPLPPSRSLVAGRTSVDANRRG